MVGCMSLADALNLIHEEIPSHLRDGLPKLVKSEGRIPIKGFSVVKVGGLESLKLTYERRLPKSTGTQKENLEKRIEFVNKSVEADSGDVWQAHYIDYRHNIISFIIDVKLRTFLKTVDPKAEAIKKS
jgi:hypothetical protein